MARYIDWAYITHKYPAFAEMAGAERNDHEYIVEGENEVDSRLAKKYAVPFSGTIPLQVLDLSADVAFYKATLLRNGDLAERLGEYINKRFEMIIDGTMQLTTSDGIVARPGAGTYNTHDYPPTFSPLNPVDWDISSQWLSDEAALRGT